MNGVSAQRLIKIWRLFQFSFRLILLMKNTKKKKKLQTENNDNAPISTFFIPWRCSFLYSPVYGMHSII